MRVIFLEDVPGTADAGEVREVKNGFARNFLLPRSLATAATVDALQRTNAIQKVAVDKRVKESSDWQVVADAIAGSHVVIEARVGPTGRLFGAVTGRHIADKLAELTGRPLEHRQVLLGEAIHDPGDYNVSVRLYREVQASVKVSVVPEGYLEQQAAGRTDEIEEAVAEEQSEAETAEEQADAEVPKAKAPKAKARARAKAKAKAEAIDDTTGEDAEEEPEE